MRIRGAATSRSSLIKRVSPFIVTCALVVPLLTGCSSAPNDYMLALEQIPAPADDSVHTYFTDLKKLAEVSGEEVGRELVRSENKLVSTSTFFEEFSFDHYGDLVFESDVVLSARTGDGSFAALVGDLDDSDLEQSGFARQDSTTFVGRTLNSLTQLGLFNMSDGAPEAQRFDGGIVLQNRSSDYDGATTTADNKLIVEFVSKMAELDVYDMYFWYLPEEEERHRLSPTIIGAGLGVVDGIPTIQFLISKDSPFLEEADDPVQFVNEVVDGRTSSKEYLTDVSTKKHGSFIHSTVTIDTVSKQLRNSYTGVAKISSGGWD